MIRPSPQYDAQNESQFRNQVEQDSIRTVRTDKAVSAILLQQDDGAVFRVTVQAGALVVTPV